MIKKGITKIALGAAIILALSGCGSSNGAYTSEAYKSAGADYAEPAYADDYDYDYEEAADFGEEYAESADVNASADEVGENAAAARSKRKLIKTVNLSLETTKMDELMSTIKSKLDQTGGYIEDSNISNSSTYSNVRRRTATITARIPAENLDDFLKAVEDGANVTTKSENVRDVTLDYVDMESHKKTLQAECDRLLELMEQTDNIDEMIVLENRLSELRYQIESMESQLRTYDNQVTYSTVYLNIEEVIEFTEIEEPEPETFVSRVTKGFSESLKSVGEGLVNFVVWFISALPYLVVWAIIIFIIVLIVRAIIKAVKKAGEKRAAKRNEKLYGKGQAAGTAGNQAPVLTMPPVPGAKAPAPSAPAPSAPAPSVPVYDPKEKAKDDKKEDKKDDKKEDKKG